MRLAGWWIAGLAFTVRVLAAWLLGGFSHPQLFEPYRMGVSLATGGGLAYAHHGGVIYRSLDAPLYPAVCALMHLLAPGHVGALLVVQMLASAATAVLIASIAGSVFGRTAGLVSGLLVALHPGLIVYSSLKAHPLTFDALWFAIVCRQFLLMSERRTLRRAVWAGVALGFGLLERPTALMLLPVAGGWLLWTAARAQRSAEVRRLAVVAGCAFLVIMPWLIRGALLHKTFVFIRTDQWEVFWRGNNPHATGHTYVRPGLTVYQTLPPEQRAELESLPDEIAQGQWFRDQALGYIRAHPGLFVARTLKKFLMFWWFAPQAGALYPRAWLMGYQLFYLAAAGLALLGMWSVARLGDPRQRAATTLLAGSVLAVAAAQSLYYVDGRHRWSVEPLLLVLAGAGLSAWRSARAAHA